MNARTTVAATSLIFTAFIFLSALLTRVANAQETSLSLYGGMAGAAPLTSILRVRELGMERFFITTLALTRSLTKDPKTFGVETEGQITWHSGNEGPIALNGAIVGRVLPTPWDATLDGSFAFGLGLSYAFGIPPIERRELGQSSRTLLYLMFEYEFKIGTSPWGALFRIHHRSGIFGLFGEVTGGSDYLCLGIRYRW